MIGVVEGLGAAEEGDKGCVEQEHKGCAEEDKDLAVEGYEDCAEEGHKGCAEEGDTGYAEQGDKGSVVEDGGTQEDDLYFVVDIDDCICKIEEEMNDPVNCNVGENGQRQALENGNHLCFGALGESSAPFSMEANRMVALGNGNFWGADTEIVRSLCFLTCHPVCSDYFHKILI